MEYVFRGQDHLTPAQVAIIQTVCSVAGSVASSNVIVRLRLTSIHRCYNIDMPIEYQPTVWLIMRVRIEARLNKFCN